MIFFIGALCIISFTTGIVVGLKFAGGTEREIVDDKTYNAVRDIGTRVSGLLNDKKTQTADASAYPTSEYPYVIRVEEKLTEEHAKSIATYLSNKGHTVILTQNSNKIDLYTGPYKNISQAKKSLKIIALYPSYSNTNKLKIMQRR
ncbi:MAG TPA: hypothetical protein PK926_01420 [Spirochaetota bacterium]|nr:hypothetical protein [Spirochaetota bacterium]HPI88083.1 hypothetical protein [Spirochaetota bacterium]HPR46432.1 hypothetical protein [Spirochaetota bacterium]